MQRAGRSPASQCITLSRNCAFWVADEAFIPIGRRSGPDTCAENMAASPKTATRPRPNVIAAPWSIPSAAMRGVASLNSHALLGNSSTVSGSRRRGLTLPLARNAWPTKLVTRATRSPAFRPRVIGWFDRDPSLRWKRNTSGLQVLSVAYPLPATPHTGQSPLISVPAPNPPRRSPVPARTAPAMPRRPPRASGPPRCGTRRSRRRL